MGKVFLIKKPADCTVQELRSFYDLLIEGGQVNKRGLKDRIKSAELLGFCIVNNEVVGIAAVKKPNVNYKKRVFKEAKVSSLAPNYTYEVGYAVTKESNTRQGISSALINKLMSKSVSNVFFATTKSNGMRNLFNKIGFKQLGEDYLNSQEEILSLYGISLNKI